MLFRSPLDKFVSETIGLGDIEEAFAKMGRGEVLRSVQRVLLERAGVNHATVQVECDPDEDCRSSASHA